MRYAKGRREETRQRVLDVASRRFRKDGIEAAGVAGLMADAGLTHGGFYAHFASKEALVQDAVATALTATRAHLTNAVETARAAGGDGLEAIVATYLRPVHRDRPDVGCAVASLAAELARHPAETRLVLTDQVAAIITIIKAALPEEFAGDAADAAAMAIFSTMVGALQLARAVTDPGLSDRFLAAGREAALRLGRRPRR
ncbi:TetR/AcrR family transcriptional regulator [Phreatobacter stygius]|uniref:TetR/AcrR family transcriptional regulator n=1 Tax=Phreatobacter stygius TaxID=1940610 RepID=A0A4D7ARD3_9HYPH|nr:TetR/AcrR family transcriptional regulator [Phreatobacter stygius]QCI63914.1 TetR/AcrR family transcriptional regulator [Phreatobacter stygius]